MDSSKIAVKLFVAAGQDPAVLSAEAVVPVFQSWIRTHAVPDHLLIDVADYAHVPDGPGTVLVAREANLSTDRGGGRPGLLYQRKRHLPGDLRSRLGAVFQSALSAADRLESAPGLAGRLKFRTDELAVRVYDRLLAPNGPETFAAIEPALSSLLAELYPGESPRLERSAPAEAIFEVSVKVAGAPTIKTLLERLGPLAVGVGT